MAQTFNANIFGQANTQISTLMNDIERTVNIALQYDTLPIQFSNLKGVGKGKNGLTWYTSTGLPTVQERDGTTPITVEVQSIGKIDLVINRFPVLKFRISQREMEDSDISQYDPFIQNHVEALKRFICACTFARVPALAGASYTAVGGAELKYDDFLDVEREMNDAGVPEGRYAVVSPWQKNKICKELFGKNLILPVPYATSILADASFGKLSSYESFYSNHVYLVKSGLSNKTWTYHNPFFQGKPFVILSKDMTVEIPLPGVVTSIMDVGGLSAKMSIKAVEDAALGFAAEFTLEMELAFGIKNPLLIWDVISVETRP